MRFHTMSALFLLFVIQKGEVADESDFNDKIPCMGDELVLLQVAQKLEESAAQEHPSEETTPFRSHDKRILTGSLAAHGKEICAKVIVCVTVLLALLRPGLGANRRLEPDGAAFGGACLMLVFGILPPSGLSEVATILVQPLCTILSLMIIAIIVQKCGLFGQLAASMVNAARGSGVALFTIIFFSGAVAGLFFTNDAMVLILTPMVFEIVEDIAEPDWTLSQKQPFYFSVLYVANLVSPLVIGNPINIVVARIFNMEFVPYAQWMTLPAVISMLVSYVGLWLVFRKDIPPTFKAPIPHRGREHDKISSAVSVCAAIVVALTLSGFFVGQHLGVPTAGVAVAGAAIMLVLHCGCSCQAFWLVMEAVGWDVLRFACGILVVAAGLQHSGVTDHLGDMLKVGGPASMNFATAYTAAVSSALINNHPVANIMAMAIRSMQCSSHEQKNLAFAALIGGDLGPKMLPIGSLAAMMWFGILRERGVVVPYWLYIGIGIPVSLVAILGGVLSLNMEMLVFSE